MIVKCAIITALLCCGALAFGQNGNYFITNLTPDERIDPRSLAVAQNDLGVIYFTNKNGILEFDGNSWRLIATPGSVYTILSIGKDIYAGGSFGFGKLVSETGKTTEFRLISDKPNIFSSLKYKDNILFCNETDLYSYSLPLAEVERTVLSGGGENYFTGLHLLGGEPHIGTTQGGLQRIANGLLSNSQLPIPPNESLMFSLLFSNGESMLGMESGKIFVLKSDKSIIPFPLADAEYLDHHNLVNGTLVKDDIVALGTLKGGVLFADAKTGATKEIIDYHTGLPDNDVLTLFTDRNDGVWVAHEYGFSRVSPSLPFRSFNHYPGLSGNLTSVKATTDGQLLVGTTLGLYYLTTEEQYEEVEVVERTNVKQEIKPVIEKEKSRKKLFGFLKGKKEEPKTVAPAPAPLITQKLVKRTKRILKSRQHVYKKIEGIDGKVNQLLEVDNKTIVAGLFGAYVLNGIKVEPIFHEPVRYIFRSSVLNQLFISTYDDRTISLASFNNVWRETHYTDTLHDYISYIFEDDLENIWFCGKVYIHKMELVDGAIEAFISVPIQNPQFDETVGLALGNEVYVAASGEFKKYDEARNAFIVYDSLPGPKRYFASAGYFWFNDGHQWRTISKNLQNFKLEWLGLFPNLRYLSPTGDGKGLWIVTAKNELYRFDNPQNDNVIVNYPLFLRDVRGEQIRLLEDKNLSLSQTESTVYFEFTQPNYMGFQATEFRYMVRGLTNDWSNWSNVNNVIPLPYLPPGEYQIAVQSRDILGKVSEVELVTFEVLPYYWKRWWFYALEFTFFSILVVISIKLGQANNRYRVISQVLSLLTVILLIQFIETGINSFLAIKSSPVVEFLIQLGITMVVFPVESKLQSWMRSVAAGRYKLKEKKGR
jgi:hypothetical protein